MASCCLLPYWSNAHTDTLLPTDLSLDASMTYSHGDLWKALKDEAIALITCPLLKTGATQSGR